MGHLFLGRLQKSIAGGRFPQLMKIFILELVFFLKKCPILINVLMDNLMISSADCIHNKIKISRIMQILSYSPVSNTF